MTSTINAFQEYRSGKPMTYAAPGTTVSRVYAGTKTPTAWHRFVLWDNAPGEDQSDRYVRVRDWCRAHRLAAPTMRSLRGYGSPIFVATASVAKAMLFKLTFGGVA